MPATTILYDPAVLRAWREDAGLKRERVCSDLQSTGVKLSLNWLAQLEGGIAPGNPSLVLLTALAGYYGKDIRDLLPGTAAAS